jgi:golgi pH regulator
MMMVPKATSVWFRAVLDSVLGGDLEFQFFHRWFNGIFLASASFSMLLFYGQYRSSQTDDSFCLPSHSRTSV